MPYDFDVDFSPIAKLSRVYKEASGRRGAEDALNSGDVRGAIAKLIGAGDTAGARALVEHLNVQNSVYGTPIYGIVDGKPAIGSFDKSGSFRPINTGNFEVTPGVKTIDTGTGTAVIGSKSGLPISGGAQPGSAVPGQSSPGYFPKDVAGEAEQKKFGAEQGDKLSQLGAKKQALGTALESLAEFGNLAKETMRHPGLSRTTGFQSYFPNIRGGDAANAQAKIDALKDRSAITVLMAMREASKTGGAIGSVTEKEYPILQNNITELNQAQDPASYRRALAKLVQYTEGMKQRLQEAYDADYVELRRPSPQQSGRAPIPQPGGMKTIGGKNYIKIGNDWYEQ